MSRNEFDTALKIIVEKLNQFLEKDIIIIGKKNCDGLTAGSLFSYVLLKSNTKFTLRLEADLDSDILSKIASENHDLNIFIDFNSMEISKINNLFKNKFIIINHDVAFKEQIKEYEEKIINPYVYGIDGNREITSCGLTFLLSEKFNIENKKLSILPIVSALAENQNLGPKKSLVGLNAEIASMAESMGILSIRTDLIFNKLDQKSLPEALAYNISPYIEGITWNRENCYKILKNAGIVMNRGRKMRTFAEISEEEKNMLLDAITKFIFLSHSRNDDISNHIEKISNNLIGCIFEFTKEDINSILKNAMDFVFAIKSCINYKKTGLAIGICMGERNNTLTEIEELVLHYKTNIMNSLGKIFKEKWRILDRDFMVFVHGEGILNDEIINDISLILGESLSFKKKLLFLRTLTNDEMYKFYIKKGVDYNSKKLDYLLREYQRYENQIRNFDDQAIIDIPFSKVDEFYSLMRKRLSENENM